MNKKLLVGIVVILLLIAGFYFFTKKSTSPSNKTVVSEDTTSKDSGTKKGSLTELFAGAGGPSQTCTFENTTTAGVASGVVYTSENKMRGDFSVNVEGKITESHMIVMDKTSYIWQDGNKTGFKSTFGEESLELLGTNSKEESKTSNTGETTQTPDQEPQGTYKCKGWSVDGSFFELPKGIEFISTSEIMKNVGNGTGSNCSVCNNLSGDQKAQCLSALKC